MTGLLLIICEAEGERFAAAMEVAAASAALDRPVSLLLRGPAVQAMRRKDVADAMAMLLELGADIGVCQTAMATFGLVARDLPAGLAAHGMVHFLAGREDWQMLLV